MAISCDVLSHAFVHVLQLAPAWLLAIHRITLSLARARTQYYRPPSGRDPKQVTKYTIVEGSSIYKRS